MTRRLPPNPNEFRSLADWAKQFYEFSLSLTRITTENDPLPVLLAHQTEGQLPRAAEDGILMFDPQTEQTVVSTGGDWNGISCVPSYTATQIADQSNVVNTRYKHAGKVIYDSTNETLMVATGDGATDDWARLTVATTVTPS